MKDGRTRCSDDTPALPLFRDKKEVGGHSRAESAVAEKGREHSAMALIRYPP